MKACVIILFLFSLPLVLGIGASPARYDIDFTPNYEHTFQFIIRNNAQHDMWVNVTTGGSLSEYTTISRKDLIAVPEGGTATVDIHLKLPESIEKAGQNIIKIQMLEVPKTGGGVSARTAVTPWIVVNVPYPGRYAQITQFRIGGEAKGVNEGLNATGVFAIKNYGEEILVDTRADIVITDRFNNTLDTLTFNDISIEPTKEKKVTFMLPTDTYLPYDYDATLFYRYDDVVREQHTVFRIGYFDAVLTQFPKNITQNGIVALSFSINSHWNGIMDVDATLSVEGSPETKSARTRIAAFKTANIKAFLDTTRLELGEQEGNLTLDLQELGGSSQKTTKKVPITFALIPEQQEEEFAMNWAITLVIAAIIILIVANSLILLHVSKKRKK